MLGIKSDIKKFCASVDHQILLALLKKKITNQNIIWLLTEIINSFSSEQGMGKGIPLGNLTSQVFANIYMNELDQFIKHQLKVKYYLRYADDFIILSNSKRSLEILVDPIEQFLKTQLCLKLHPDKIIFRKLSIKINSANFNQSLQSYLGYLKHSNSYRLEQGLKNQIWFWFNRTSANRTSEV